MARRSLAVVFAVSLAVIGAALVLFYARSADARALEGQQVVDVYVATKDIPAGTSAKDAVDRGWLRKESFSQKGVPAGALTDVAGPITQQVAATDIAAGEIVLTKRFADQKLGQAAVTVPEGFVAVTVQLTDPARIGPFLRPGSKIALYDTYNAKDAKVANADRPNGAKLTNQDGDLHVTKVLLPNVEVLGVGANTIGGNQAPTDQRDGAQPVPSALVTVAVSPADAQRLVHATQTGTLYAALLGAGAEVKAGGSVLDTTLFSGAAS
ncbi:MAG TPA: Flp pilus assembly protein CpaB [Actinomycetales bacterium]|nr:Flp pilus assembly protein CpaB [Actinomycetales bacterium]